ncbi:MAG: transcription antitermination factor NusB [Phycisphaerales bacterium]
MTGADTGSFGPSGPGASAAPADARDRAIRRLARRARQFPDLAIGSVETGGLDPRDAALARAIDEGVVRRWLTLSFLLRELSGHELATLEPKMQGVLLAGAFQLLFLDRVPDHAVLDESVGWAKANIRPKASGFANAILRKVANARGEPRDAWTNAPDEIPLDSGGALALVGLTLPNDDAERTSVATGVPRALIDRWIIAWGTDEARRIAHHSIARAPTILRTAHDPDWTDAPGTSPHAERGHRVFAGSHADLESLLGANPRIWAQDPASAGAVASVAGLAPKLIADVCAGRGTKTRQLAETFPDARIVASDPDADRAKDLRAAFADHPRVEVMPPDRAREACLSRADLVLLDVPCSNTGVLARRPEARHRAGDAAVARLVDIQRQILADAIPLLAPAGVILYATCSVERAENEDQAAWAERWHGVARDRERRCLPSGGPGTPAGEHTDGGYSVLLRPGAG